MGFLRGEEIEDLAEPNFSGGLGGVIEIGEGGGSGHLSRQSFAATAAEEVLLLPQMFHLSFPALLPFPGPEHGEDAILTVFDTAFMHRSQC